VPPRGKRRQDEERRDHNFQFHGFSLRFSGPTGLALLYYFINNVRRQSQRQLGAILRMSDKTIRLDMQLQESENE
jgi:hypothetical protein